MLLQKVPVHRVCLLVLDSLGGGEFDGDGDRLVRRQVGAGQVLRRPAVHHGADEPGQKLVPAVGSLGGGGEAQGVGREEHLRYHRVLLRRQMMHLVVDDEREAVPVAFGVDVRRVVGRHGERCDLMVATAQKPDRNRRAKRVREYRVPLLQESEGGYHDERAPPRALDSPHSDSRFPGSGGQDHGAPQLLPAPGGKGLPLVRARLHRYSGFQGELLETGGAILVGRAQFAQSQHGLAVGARRRPPLLGATVPDKRFRGPATAGE